MMQATKMYQSRITNHSIPLFLLDNLHKLCMKNELKDNTIIVRHRLVAAIFKKVKTTS